MCKPSTLSNISPHILARLREIGEIGEKISQSIYVVGGFVRDLLLGSENSDLDIVVEGDAIHFAHRLAQAWGGAVQVYPEFGTATVVHPDGLKIDFVSARRETYAHPGALPSVKYGIITDDLRRRDFSINALALQLNPDTFGQIVDCTGGVCDLQAGQIRVLHDRSFIDDPTRIFRAIRYEQRYDFRIVKGDEERMRDAIDQGVLNLISGQRIRNEIDHILLEEAAPKIIARMREFNLFRAIHPAWEMPDDFDRLWTAARQAIDWASQHLPEDGLDGQALLWMPLFASASVVEVISERLALRSPLRAKLIASVRLCSVIESISASAAPSEVYRLLNPYPLEALAFALTQPSQPAWRAGKIRDYLICSRKIQPLITGADLIQLGMEPSRVFAELLWKAFATQLDGKIQTKQEAYQILGILKDNV